jgi:hypothetical protein
VPYFSFYSPPLYLAYPTLRGPAELRSEIGPVVLNVINNALPYTSDDNLIQFAKFFIKASSAYNNDDPSACYLNANPERDTSGVLLNISKQYKELTAEEQKIESKVIKGYTGKKASLFLTSKVFPCRLELSMWR